MEGTNHPNDQGKHLATYLHQTTAIVMEHCSKLMPFDLGNPLVFIQNVLFRMTLFYSWAETFDFMQLYTIKNFKLISISYYC